MEAYYFFGSRNNDNGDTKIFYKALNLYLINKILMGKEKQSILAGKDSIIDGILFLLSCYGLGCVLEKLQVLDGVIFIWKKK